MLRYCIGYLVKPAKLAPDRLDEFNRVVAHLKLVVLFGDMYGHLKMGRDPATRAAVECPRCGSLAWVSSYDVQRARETSYAPP